MSDAIILIDGQNLYYGLKDLQLTEWNIIWDKLFKSFLSPEDKLLRTYWFRPNRILDTHFSSDSIRASVCFKKFNNYFNAYKSNFASVPDHIKNQIETIAKEAEGWLADFKEKFSQSEYKYDQISGSVSV